MKLTKGFGMTSLEVHSLRQRKARTKMFFIKKKLEGKIHFELKNLNKIIDDYFLLLAKEVPL